jgi:signal transduction histidine kinase
VFPDEAVADLTAFDFDNDIIYVRGRNWEYYGSQFYTPEDFQKGAATPPDISNEDVFPDDYATHRVILRLPKGKTYGICGYSLLTSQRLFINGSIALEVGSPGETKETTTPRVQQYFYAFTPQTDTTELIYHVSNTHTSDGAGRYSFYVGGLETIYNYIYRSVLANSITAGCLVAAFLFYLGMFIFARGKWSFIYFSFICLLVAIRGLLMEEKILMAAFHEITWFAGMAMEYLCMVALLALFTLYINALYPKLLHRVFIGIVLTACTAYTAVILTTEPVFYTQFRLHFTVFLTLSAVIEIVLLTIRNIKAKPKRLSDMLLLTGFLSLVVAAAYDAALLVFSISSSGFLLQSATFVCVLIHMVALALDFSRSEIDLLNARMAERELAVKNAMLEQSAKMREDMVHTLSHEVRTPLAVMSVYAQLAVRKISEGQADSQTLEGLTAISDEAQRLAELASGALSPKEQGDSLMNLTEIATQLVRLFEPMFAKECRNISMSLTKPLFAFGNVSEITQVIWNLIDNALKHAKGGDIEIDGNATAEDVYVIVGDNGDGISPAILPKVFERGISESGGSGLGLAIAKEIVEKHGGTLLIESEHGLGTTATLVLPAYSTRSIAHE